MDTGFYTKKYLAENPLEKFRTLLERWEDIRQRRQDCAALLSIPAAERFWCNLSRLKPFKAAYTDFTGNTVTIGRQAEMTTGELQLLHRTLLDLRPWRKGPFNYFGIQVESEWRSFLKWDRVMSMIKPELEDRIIADVGCNNSYYMYRILPLQPAFVLGFDPMERYYFHFLLNQQYVQADKLHFELMGVDDLFLFKNFFDVVFFMGILYHRRNPIRSLEAVAACMKKDGLLVLESAGIMGKDPVCLIPGRRYMKAKGYWFMPTAGAICNMLNRTGFTGVRVHASIKTTSSEQSRTPWVNTESLPDFLDPADPEKTVEGYPAPYRIYISARKK